MQSNSPPTSQQLARRFLALRPLVASGVPPDVEGGILPPGRKSVHISAGGGGFQRLLRRTILAAGQDAPLYGRPEARRYYGGQCRNTPQLARSAWLLLEVFLSGFC